MIITTHETRASLLEKIVANSSEVSCFKAIRYEVEDLYRRETHKTGELDLYNIVKLPFHDSGEGPKEALVSLLREGVFVDVGYSKEALSLVTCGLFSYVIIEEPKGSRGPLLRLVILGEKPS